MPPKKKQQVEEIKGSEEELIAPKTKPKSAKQPATKKGTGRGTRRGGDSSEEEDDDIDFEDFLDDEDHSASTKTGSRAAKPKSNKVLRTNEATDVKVEQQRQSAVISRAQRNKSKAQIVKEDHSSIKSIQYAESSEDEEGEEGGVTEIKPKTRAKVAKEEEEEFKGGESSQEEEEESSESEKEEKK